MEVEVEAEVETEVEVETQKGVEMRCGGGDGGGGGGGGGDEGGGGDAGAQVEVEMRSGGGGGGGDEMQWRRGWGLPMPTRRALAREVGAQEPRPSPSSQHATQRVGRQPSGLATLHEGEARPRSRGRWRTWSSRRVLSPAEERRCGRILPGMNPVRIGRPTNCAGGGGGDAGGDAGGGGDGDGHDKAEMEVEMQVEAEMETGMMRWRWR